MAKTSPKNWLHHGLIKVTQLHFILVLAYVVQLIAYHAGNLITPDILLRRWIASALLFACLTAIWYAARDGNQTLATSKRLVLSLILLDTAFASFNVYIQRGMASRAVLLFALPILVSALLRRRSALLATAALCAVAYSTTAISYFVLNFNEGYKIELYGEISFYCVMFFLLALMCWPLIRRDN